MGEETTVKNAKLYVLKDDGKYEEAIPFNITGIQEDIHFKDELSHKPDLVKHPQSFSFSCDVQLHVPLRTLILLFGFAVGFKMWLRMKFRRK